MFLQDEGKFMKAIYNTLKLKTSLVNRDYLLKFHFLIHMTHLAVPLIQAEITPRYPEKTFQAFNSSHNYHWEYQRAVFFLHDFSLRVKAYLTAFVG